MLAQAGEGKHERKGKVGEKKKGTWPRDGMSL